VGLELDFLFHPKSIAVAGASEDPRKQGNAYLRLLRERGFNGPVYAVNPRGTEILGSPSFTSVSAIPDLIDYVISTVPAKAVPNLIDECAAKGVKVVHLFTGRFSETGHEDAAALEQDVLVRARRAGIRLIGPNGMGLHYAHEGITFKDHLPTEPGTAAAMAQSGGNAVEMVLGPAARGVRFGKVLSYGNGLDLNEADFLEYFAEDPETSLISIYLEGAREGRRFFEALKRAASVKPVVIWKGGRTSAGTRAVSSHTASLAGDAAVWDAVCRQAGAVPVANMEEMVDVVSAFYFLPLFTGVRTAVAGGGGGQSVQSADVCEEAGLVVSPFPEPILAALRERDPEYWDWLSNPVDGSILGASPWKMDEMAELLTQSPDYDLVINNVNEQWALDTPEAARGLPKSLDALLAVQSRHAKPTAVVLGEAIQPQGWQTEILRDLRSRCVAAGVPTFPSIARAASALKRVSDYYRRRSAAGE
jgi:acyl-CoA synthetase (NDP forming)